MDGFSKYHFKDMGESEEIVMVLHRNWFYLLQQYFLILLVSGIFYGSILVVPEYFPDFLRGLDKPVSLFAQNFFMLSIWIYGFLIWVDYYFDIWIVTNQRIINIEQKGMFTRKVSEMTYAKMQDISTEVIGFIPTMLNYGDVRVQTAGENENFIFRTISDPYHVKTVIAQMQNKSKNDSAERFGEILKEKMEE